MKVLLVNGSPHEMGVTYTALREIAASLDKAGVESEIFWLGVEPIAGCIGCAACRNSGECFRRDIVNEFVSKAAEADGFVFGCAVHYAAATGAMSAFLDRVFYSASAQFAGKPGAAVVSCRRAGATAALDELNKYFTISGMPVVSSQYWNMLHGNTPEEAAQDKEGLAVMRLLGDNMAWLLRCIEAGKAAGIELPPQALGARTNFVR